MLWRSEGRRAGFAFLLAVMVGVGGCGKSPTGPGPLIGPDELEKIPFDRIHGKIAFRRELPGQELVSHLLILDGEQRTLRAVVTFPDAVLANLDWSPEGDRLVFSFFAMYGAWATVWHIYMMPATGGSAVSLTNGPNHSSYPEWSPDGKRIAFWSEETGSSIWVVDLETMEYTRLFGVSWSTRTRPAWAPDGNDLVVVSEDSLARATLFRVRLDSLQAQVLFTAEETSDRLILKSPIFSPDGSQLAFVHYTVDPSQSDAIWLIDADGGNVRQLTTGPHDWNPAWSPDGRQILFSRDGDLFLVNADGSDLVQVTFGVAADEYPAWGR